MHRARTHLNSCISTAFLSLSRMADPARLGAISPLSFADYNSQLQIAVLKATKNAAVLPADIGFYTSMGKDLAHEVNATSARILTLTNRLLDLVVTGETGSAKGKKRARLECEEDVQDSFRSTVVDAMDQLLERTVCDAIVLLSCCSSS